MENKIIKSLIFELNENLDVIDVLEEVKIKINIEFF
jgi:hypothetical protein